MKRQSRKEKKLDREIELEYYRQAQGVQISIMNIGKVFADCQADITSGNYSLVDAVGRAIAKYCEKV